MRNRADSIHVQTKIMQAVFQKTQPPEFVLLDNDERQYFDTVVKARAEWSQLDLIHAVNLARVLCKLSSLQAELNRDGYILPDGKPNPKAALVDTLSRLSLSYCRFLNVHAAATQGRARNQIRKNQAFGDAQDAVDGLDDTNLIARPH